MTEVPAAMVNYSEFSKDAYRLLHFASKNDAIYTEMNKLTRDVDALLALIRHPVLYTSIHSAAIKEFVSLNAAITEAVKSPESFLVSFPTINMYAVFTPESYIKFLHEYKKNPQEGAPTELYQVVLSCFPQKLVLISDVADYHAQICQTASELFGVSTVVDGNRITVNTTAETVAELEEMHDRLITAVRVKGGIKMRDSIKFQHTETAAGIEFTLYDLVKTLSERIVSVEKILEALGSAPRTTTNNYHFYGNNCNNNINSSNNNSVMTATPSAVQYILDNPPSDQITKKDYHDRFLSQTGIPAKDMGIKKFGKLVAGAGYKKRRVPGGYGWKK